MLRRPLSLLVLALIGATLVPAAATAKKPVGTVVKVRPLRHALWLPGTTSKAVRLTYISTNARGKRALSTGIVWLPKGKAPSGGWPVISWAHGTSGLGDACAPSVVGPALPKRDRPYLANWMRQGYAIVASDYAGLGTAGLPAYLNGRSEAHNVVDMVKAGRSWAKKHSPASRRLARKWVVVGQSQGGGAAIYTARYATEFGGASLDYRGAVGTGVPAYIEQVLDVLGPNFHGVGAATLEYFTYVLTSLRSVYPGLGIDGTLTPTGRKYFKLAETSCSNQFEEKLKGVDVGGFFTRDIKDLPGFSKTVNRYMAMPEKGFDKPFFIGQGTLDDDVPIVINRPYVQKLKANHQPVTYKVYNSDHNGTLILSQKDSHPFVKKLFKG